MNSFDSLSPTLGPIQLAAGHAPPTPPHEGPLDDIYGSAPSSPLQLSHEPLDLNTPRDRPHEILSDLPSRQRALDTDAYREGLANSKGQFVQEGFDEGYSLGANLGLRVGYILGVLQGFVAALKGHDEQSHKEVKEMYEAAQREMAIQELLSQSWIDEEGIWKWEVKGKEEDPTLREVAEQHPVVRKWMGNVEELAERWGVDLRAVEKTQAAQEQS
ncbi:Essential protein Yae1, N terminal [Neocucurbitaria cava]|uniref:Protein YAE1 n=1 Tax=Neocucurbitaria cava TaxID=798079 RepID=A0A9W9CQ10_9PLEO|nr:Essential protein Yae1, N terminal [Neocucurbitaria cava]